MWHVCRKAWKVRFQPCAEITQNCCKTPFQLQLPDCYPWRLCACWGKYYSPVTWSHLVRWSLIDSTSHPFLWSQASSFGIRLLTCVLLRVFATSMASREPWQPEAAYVSFYLHFQCLPHNSCSINIWVDDCVSGISLSEWEECQGINGLDLGFRATNKNVCVHREWVSLSHTHPIFTVERMFSRALRCTISP